MVSQPGIRFIVCHIHKTSARLRFLCVGNHVCTPEALPPLVSLMDIAPKLDGVGLHPSLPMQRLAEDLQLPVYRLTLANGFRSWVEAPRQTIAVYMAMDLSEEAFQAPEGTHWMELTKSLELSETERLLLRDVYDWLLG